MSFFTATIKNKLFYDKKNRCLNRYKPYYLSNMKFSQTKTLLAYEN